MTKIVGLDHKQEISNLEVVMAIMSAVKPHLSIRALRKRFRTCDDAVEKFHGQAILLRQQGRGTGEVAEICARSPKSSPATPYSAGGRMPLKRSGLPPRDRITQADSV